MHLSFEVSFCPRVIDVTRRAESRHFVELVSTNSPLAAEHCIDDCHMKRNSELPVPATIEKPAIVVIKQISPTTQHQVAAE